MNTLPELAASLGVTVASLERLGVKREGGAWLNPERDSDGAVIGWAKRFDDGRKRFVRGGNRGLAMAWPIEAYAGTSADDPVLIVEGMSDAAAGLDLGFVTVGRPSATGGADHLRPLLRGRHVAIVAENDRKEGGDWPGKRGAEAIASKLTGEAASVRIVYPYPDDLKDLRKWKNAGGGLDRATLLSAIKGAAEFVPATEPTEATAGRPESISQSERLVRLALELYRIGRTDVDEPFAVSLAGPNLAIMFRGSRDALRSVLAREYRRRFGGTPSATALTDALVALQGEALDAEAEPVHLRVAEHGSGVVIDLGDTTGRAVVVDAEGWRVLDASPVLFRRTALTDTLPIPQQGGTLDLLRELLNVADEGWPLLVGWLVAAMLPTPPHPILLLGGEQGTGKTTAGRMLIGLVDPSPAMLRSEPRDPEAWALTAAGSWIVGIDNISHIPGWFSDALCKAVTGDGWVRRRLYSDSDLSVVSFRRVVVLTSIDAGGLRGDLGDRVLLLDLERIDDARRRGEVEVRGLYAERRPLIFGALLDVAAAVLRRLPDVKLETMPRMADFARILAALDLACPELTGGRALTLFVGQRSRIAGDVIESDAFASAVVRFAREVGSWSGTAGELLARLTPEGRLPRDWPTSAKALSGRLRRLRPALLTVGVHYDSPPPKDKTRTHRLEKVGEQPPEPPEPPSDGPVAVKNGDLTAGISGGTDSPTAQPPGNRPDSNPHFEGENADSGGLGGLGGTTPAISGSDWGEL